MAIYLSESDLIPRDRSDHRNTLPTSSKSNQMEVDTNSDSKKISKNVNKNSIRKRRKIKHDFHCEEDDDDNNNSINNDSSSSSSSSSSNHEDEDGNHSKRNKSEVRLKPVKSIDKSLKFGTTKKDFLPNLRFDGLVQDYDILSRRTKKREK
jgi:hypothetical protein